MRIDISTRHGHISEATREKITAKAEKLARIFERLLAIEITLDLEHEESPRVDVRVEAEHKHDFVASEKTSSLMGSIDGALRKLEQQLRKYKQKVQDHHRSDGVRQQSSEQSQPE